MITGAISPGVQELRPLILKQHKKTASTSLVGAVFLVSV